MHLKLTNRQQFFYPPFSRIIEITLKHKDKEVVDEAAHKLALALQKGPEQFCCWPGSTGGSKGSQSIPDGIIDKAALEMKQIQQYKKVIRNHFNLLLAEKQFKSVTMIADVDAN